MSSSALGTPTTGLGGKRRVIKGTATPLRVFEDGVTPKTKRAIKMGVTPSRGVRKSARQELRTLVNVSNTPVQNQRKRAKMQPLQNRLQQKQQPNTEENANTAEMRSLKELLLQAEAEKCLLQKELEQLKAPREQSVTSDSSNNTHHSSSSSSNSSNNSISSCRKERAGGLVKRGPAQSTSSTKTLLDSTSQTGSPENLEVLHCRAIGMIQHCLARAEEHINGMDESTAASVTATPSSSRGAQHNAAPQLLQSRVQHALTQLETAAEPFDPAKNLPARVTPGPYRMRRRAALSSMPHRTTTTHSKKRSASEQEGEQEGVASATPPSASTPSEGVAGVIRTGLTPRVTHVRQLLADIVAPLNFFSPRTTKLKDKSSAATAAPVAPVAAGTPTPAAKARAVLPTIIVEDVEGTPRSRVAQANACTSPMTPAPQPTTAVAATTTTPTATQERGAMTAPPTAQQSAGVQASAPQAVTCEAGTQWSRGATPARGAVATQSTATSPVSMSTASPVPQVHVGTMTSPVCDAEGQLQAFSGMTREQLLSQLEVATISNEVLRDENGRLGQRSEEVSQTLQTVRGELNGLKEHLLSSKEESDAVIADLQERISQLTSEKEEAASRLQQLEGSAETLTALTAQRDDAMCSLEDTASELEEVKQKMAALQQLVDTNKEQRRQEEERLSQQLEASETKCAAAEEAKIQTQQQVQALQDELRREKESFESRLAQHQTSYKQLQSDMSTMYRQHKAEVTQLEQKLQSNAYETRLSELVSENRVLSAHVEELQGARACLQATATTSSEAAAVLKRVTTALEARVGELETEMAAAQRARESAEAEVSFAKAELKRMREDYAAQTRIAEDAREALDEMSFKCDELEVELEEATSRADAATREVQEAVSQLKKEQQQKQAAQAELRQASGQVDELTEELEEEKRQAARLTRRLEQAESEYAQTKQYLEQEREANRETIVELEECLQKTKTQLQAYEAASSSAQVELEECKQRLAKEQAKVITLNDQLVDKEFALEQATTQLQQAAQIREHEVGKWKRRSSKLKTFIDEYKKRTETKIAQLKKNYETAESEVSRLDRELRALNRHA